jgi:arsenate reductase-like glutaredoxin family protein
MTTNEISVYGAHWCPDCRDSKQFLGEHQIPYNWVDIEEDPAGEKFVIEKMTASELYQPSYLRTVLLRKSMNLSAGNQN